MIFPGTLLACVVAVTIAVTVLAALRTIGPKDDAAVRDKAVSVILTGIVIGIMLLICGGCVYLSHCDNVATVRYGDEAIAARTAYRDGLRRSLDTMRTVPGQLMNQDKPYTTMAEKLAEAEHSLNYTRSMVVQAKIDIESRKIGPWSLIVWWVGER